MRVRIVQQCQEQYGLHFELANITDCDGCPVEGGRLFSACLNCPIWKCARQKGLENCACCVEYACEQLIRFFGTDPAAKIRLDEIRAGVL